LSGPETGRDAAAGAPSSVGLRGLWRELRAQAEQRGVAGGLVSAFGVKVAAIAVLYLAQMLIARLLGPAAYGDYFYTYSWLAALLPFSTLGLHNAALRFVPGYAATRRFGRLRGFLLGGTALAGMSGLALAALGALAVWLAGGALGDGLRRCLLLACAILPLAAVGLLHETALRSLRLVLRGQVPPEILRPALTALLVLLALRVAEGRPGGVLAVAGLLVATALTVALSVGFVVSRLGPLVRRVRARYRRREWLGLALHMVGLTAFLALMNRLDVLMLGALAGAQVAGFYGLAAQVTAVVGFSLHTLNVVAVPMIGEAAAVAELPRLERFLRLGTSVAFGVAVVLVAGLGLWGRALLQTYGAEFGSAYGAMLVLALGQLVYVAVGPSVFVLCLTGRQQQALRLAIFGAALNAVLNPGAILAFGMVGAAGATALSTAVWAGLNLRAARRGAGIDPSIVPVRRRPPGTARS